MPNNSRVGEFFSILVEELWHWGPLLLRIWMASTLGLNIRKNINQACAIYSLPKFGNNFQRHTDSCVTGVSADRLIRQNLGLLPIPGTTSSSPGACPTAIFWPSLYWVWLLFFFFFLFLFLRLTSFLRLLSRQNYKQI